MKNINRSLFLCSFIRSMEEKNEIEYYRSFVTCTDLWHKKSMRNVFFLHFFFDFFALFLFFFVFWGFCIVWSMENCRSERNYFCFICDLPINSNASWKYCFMFWCGVSFAGICLYRTPGFACVVDCWHVTLRTQLAPTLDGSMASRPFPRRRCGNTGDAGCVSISINKN